MALDVAAVGKDHTISLASVQAACESRERQGPFVDVGTGRGFALAGDEEGPVAGADVVSSPGRVRKRIGLSGQFAAVDENLTASDPKPPPRRSP